MAMGHLAVENEVEAKKEGRRFAPLTDPKLKKTIEETIEFRKKNREIWKQNLLTLDVAVDKVRGHAESARDAILSGEGNVGVVFNLKSGLEGMEGVTDFGVGLGEISGMRPQTSFVGGVEKGVTGAKKGPRGPKRKKVAIVEAHLPEFAMSIGILGTNERTKVCEDFVAKHPEYHVKDANDLFGKFTVRKKYPFLPNHAKPNNSRNKVWFYLRAHFYDLADAEEKSKYPGWEAVKLEDDKAWEQEIKAKQEKRERYKEKEKMRKKARKETSGGAVTPPGRLTPQPNMTAAAAPPTTAAVPATTSPIAAMDVTK